MACVVLILGCSNPGGALAYQRRCGSRSEDHGLQPSVNAMSRDPECSLQADFDSGSEGEIIKEDPNTVSSVSLKSLKGLCLTGRAYLD